MAVIAAENIDAANKAMAIRADAPQSQSSQLEKQREKVLLVSRKKLNEGYRTSL